MKKRIFKGFINGQEFDNVQDYNARMTALVEAGADIDASSSTHIENVEETACEECDKATCETDSSKKDVNMFPGFERAESYLDVLVTNDAAKDAKILEDLKGYLDTQFDVIMGEVSKMEINDLLQYKRDIEDGIDAFESDMGDCHEVIKKINLRRDEIANIAESLDRDQCKINRGIKVIDTYREFYLKMQHVLNNMLACNKPSNEPRNDVFSSLMRRFMGLQ